MDWTSIITGAIATSPAIGTMVFGFWKQSLKTKILSKKLNEIDITQNSEIDKLKLEIKNISNNEIIQVLEKIQTDISELNEIHKYSRFSKKLKNQIEDETNKISLQKKIANEEIQRILRCGRENSYSIFNYILDKDFEIDTNLLNQKIIDNLTFIKEKIKLKELDLNNSDEFIEDLQVILRTLTDKYTIKLDSIIKLVNGERRAVFMKNSSEFIADIYFETFDLYQKYGRL